MDSMTGVKIKEQYISYLSFLQTLNNVSVIMLLHTFNIISLIPRMCKGNYVISVTKSWNRNTIKISPGNATIHKPLLTHDTFHTNDDYVKQDWKHKHK